MPDNLFRDLIAIADGDATVADSRCREFFDFSDEVQRDAVCRKAGRGGAKKAPDSGGRGAA